MPQSNYYIKNLPLTYTLTGKFLAATILRATCIQEASSPFLLLLFAQYQTQSQSTQKKYFQRKTKPCEEKNTMLKINFKRFNLKSSNHTKDYGATFAFQGIS